MPTHELPHEILVLKGFIPLDLVSLTAPDRTIVALTAWIELVSNTAQFRRPTAALFLAYPQSACA